MAEVRKRPVRKPRLTEEEKAKRKRVRRLKKIIKTTATAFVALVLILVAVGIFNLVRNNRIDYESSTLQLDEDGDVILYEVNDFDNQMYSKSEAKKYIKNSIKEYNENNSGSVKLKKLKIKDSKIYVVTVYSDMSEYSRYSGYEAYADKVAVLSSSLDFMDAFSVVNKGVKNEEAAALDLSKVQEFDAVAISENITVEVPGQLVAVSSRNTTVTDKYTVVIAQEDGNNDASQLVYILYKK